MNATPPTNGSLQRTVIPGELKPGYILDGRFAVTELMNLGGMACIYRAVDLEAGQPVAIKVPLLKYESEPVTFTRFQREEEILQQINHPYILKVVPAGAEKSRPYLVMEFLEGQTLNKVMAASRPLPEKMAAFIAGQLCDALECLQKNGIVHRDLKPENIMICEDGGIRLFDFGIAKATHLGRLTFTGLVPTFGTPDYMAPEQVNGRRGDHRSDIYSLGAILYEMATGKVPFEGDSPFVVMNARTTGDPAAPRSLNGQLSPQIEEIILHALARDPDERYSNAAAMKEDLDNVKAVKLTGRDKNLQPVRPMIAEEEPWMKRGLLIGLCVILIQVAAFGALLWYFTAHGRR